MARSRRRCMRAEQRLRPILMTSLAFIARRVAARARRAAPAPARSTRSAPASSAACCRHAARDLLRAGVLRRRALDRARQAVAVVKRLALACLLAGCVSLAPAYERPAAPVPASLPGGQGARANLPLGQFVREPRLRQILARVVSQNRSLRRAVLDIEAARQQYLIQRAQAAALDPTRSPRSRATSACSAPAATPPRGSPSTRPRSGSRAGRSICSAGSESQRGPPAELLRLDRERQGGADQPDRRSVDRVRRARRRPQPARDRADHDGELEEGDGPDRGARRRRHVESRRLLAGVDGLPAGARRRRAAHRRDRAGQERTRAARRRSAR